MKSHETPDIPTIFPQAVPQISRVLITISQISGFEEPKRPSRVMMRKSHLLHVSHYCACAAATSVGLGVSTSCNHSIPPSPMISLAYAPGLAWGSQPDCPPLMQRMGLQGKGMFWSRYWNEFWSCWLLVHVDY